MIKAIARVMVICENLLRMRGRRYLVNCPLILQSCVRLCIGVKQNKKKTGYEKEWHIVFLLQMLNLPDALLVLPLVPSSWSECFALAMKAVSLTVAMRGQHLLQDAEYGKMLE